jgi:hypothetical protein
LPFDRLGSLLSHDLRVTFKAKLPDLRYARGTIGFEYQPKQLGDEVIEFPAGARVREFATAGATLQPFLHAARAHLAPTSP